MKKQLLAAVCAAMLALSGCAKQALDSSGTVQDFLAENQTTVSVPENTEEPDSTVSSPESGNKPENSMTAPTPETTKTSNEPEAASIPETTKVPETAGAPSVPEAAKAPEAAEATPVPEAAKAPETATAAPVPENTKEPEHISGPEGSAQSQENESTPEPPAETSIPAPTETPEAPTEQPPAEETPAPAEETQPPAPTEAPAVCNHCFLHYYSSEPTCASTYWIEERCTYCGEPNGVRFEAGPDPHNYVDTVVSYGNCTEPAIISHVCSGCGASLPDTTGYSESARNDHDFQPYSGSEIDGEYHVVITYDCDRCTRCGKEINWVQTGCEFIVPEPAATKAPNE